MNNKKQMRRRFTIATKLTGEEYILLEDLAMRNGKSKFQLLHDIIIERLEEEMGTIDFCLPSDWFQLEKYPKRRKRKSLELQMTFTF